MNAEAYGSGIANAVARNATTPAMQRIGRNRVEPGATRSTARAAGQMATASTNSVTRLPASGTRKNPATSDPAMPDATLTA